MPPGLVSFRRLNEAGCSDGSCRGLIDGMMSSRVGPAEGECWSKVSVAIISRRRSDITACASSLEASMSANRRILSPGEIFGNNRCT